MEMVFTIGGAEMKLSREQVTHSVAGVAPARAQKLLVEIDGRLYPVKQPFALATRLDPADFTSHQARSVLKRLGFRVLRVASD